MEKDMVEHEMEFKGDFRYNQSIKEKIEWLIKSDVNLESTSHLVRVAIIKLYNEEVKKNVDKGITTHRD